MKKIISFIAVTLAVISCTQKQEKTDENNSDRIEITPLIVNRVICQDTLIANREYNDTSRGKPIESASYDGNPALYLKNLQFDKLKESLWTLMKNPNAKILFGINGGAPDWNKPASKQEIRDKMIVCDSIAESSFDPEGNEIITSKFYCDSTSIMDAICQIYFYESWFFNKKSNMIERDVLGYSVFRYDVEKQAFRQLFYVFKDEESFKVAKKNYTEL